MHAPNGSEFEGQSKADVRLQMAMPKTGTWRVEAVMDVPLDPSQAYEILVDPSKERIFKDVKQVKKWQVVEDDGKKQVIKVEQVTKWKFMCFGGTCSSLLKMEHDKETRTVKFDHWNDGDSQRMQGIWVVEEKPISGQDRGDLSSLLDDGMGYERPAAKRSSIRLVQQLSLATPPPKTAFNLIANITFNAAKGLMHDVYQEADRIHRGRPIELPTASMQRQFYWKDRTMRRKRRIKRTSPPLPRPVMVQG